MGRLSWNIPVRPVRFASGNRTIGTEDRPCAEDIRSSKVLAPEVGSETLTPAQHILATVASFPLELAWKVSMVGNGSWPRPVVLKAQFYGLLVI